MIYGVGIDIVKIKRIKDASERWGGRFLERVFTEGEISYCLAKKDPYTSFSVRFAAKEALIKAIGSEIAVSMREMEVVNLGSGKPELKTSGRLREFLENRGIALAHLSLSHEKEYGIACVVLEKAGY